MLPKRFQTTELLRQFSQCTMRFVIDINIINSWSCRVHFDLILHIKFVRSRSRNHSTVEFNSIPTTNTSPFSENSILNKNKENIGIIPDSAWPIFISGQKQIRKSRTLYKNDLKKGRNDMSTICYPSGFRKTRSL